MNLKAFLIGSISAGIAYFLLGWLFYGILFASFFPPSENENLGIIFLGCLTFAVLVSFVLNYFKKEELLIEGFKIGLVLGLLTSLSYNLFMPSSSNFNVSHAIIDIGITSVCGAIIGMLITFIHSKIK